MARYCSIASYRKILSSLGNAKDNCLRDLKNGKSVKYSQSLINERLVSNGFVKDVIGHITKSNSVFENIKKIVSVSSDKLQNKKQIPGKQSKTKNIKREIQKLVLKLQKKTLKHNHVLYASAGVSAVNIETNVQVDIQSDAATIAEPIPEPPPIPQEIVDETINQFNALGEASLQSIGLGGYSPAGFMQQAFEYLHVHLGLEWWAAIALGTVIIRLLLFPLVIMSQRNAAKMNNYLPQMQAIQLKMTEARQTGNQIDAARYGQELMIFMTEKQLNPLKNMIVPLAQMPFFVSVFIGLRGMANAPVESFRTGGMLWFPDLTLSDQYFLLPIITSATLYATLELGTDSAKLSTQNAVFIKYGLKALPLIILPFTFNFPGAILCYWASSNFISLLQVGFLRIPKVRDYFKIEALQKFDSSSLPMKNKGFMEGVKESWTNMKITKELEERRKLDEIQFQKAGKGPIVKTFKYDPTKQGVSASSAPVSAKKG